jgi:hypothetical protein
MHHTAQPWSWTVGPVIPSWDLRGTQGNVAVSCYPDILTITTSAALNSPAFIFPTAVATTDEARNQSYSFGEAAVSQISSSKSVHYPIRLGLVDDWDNTERLWQHCIEHCMRVDPEDHYFLLTEPPFNTPENREQTAEIMFETYKVPGLHIGQGPATHAPCILQLPAGRKALHSCRMQHAPTQPSTLTWLLHCRDAGHTGALCHPARSGCRYSHHPPPQRLCSTVHLVCTSINRHPR